MGILSDYLERNREVANFDICLIVPCGKANSSASHSSAEFMVGQAVREQLKKKKDWQEALEKQVEMLLNAQTYEQQFASSLYLVNECVFKQNQLRQLIHTHHFVTAEVIDTINEYIELIEHSMKYAHDRLTEAKLNIDDSSQCPAYNIDEKTEKYVMLVTLLDSLFYYLSFIATVDDSHFIQNFFQDISLIIQQLDQISPLGKKPKEICSDFFEKNYHPTYGIDTCENCGTRLYKECPYCFNCYERN